MILVGLCNNNNKIKVVKLYSEFKDKTYFVYREYGKFGTGLSKRLIKKIDAKIYSANFEASKQIMKQKKVFESRGFVDYTIITREPFDLINKQKLLLLLRNYFNINVSFQPMIAIDFEKISNSMIDKTWLVTPYIDGIRCFVSYNNSEIKIITNNGILFVDEICNNVQLKKMFEKHSCIRLDCVIKDNKLFVLDLIDTTMQFSKRYDVLYDLYIEFFLDLNDEKQEKATVVFLDADETDGYFGLMHILKRYQKKYGCNKIIARLPDKTYEINGCDKRMIYFYDNEEN